MRISGKYSQPKMVNWYDPRGLWATAMRVIISGTFASYADKRELQAALDIEKKPFDCSLDDTTTNDATNDATNDTITDDTTKDDATKKERDEIWIDFISDTGDGFNPTYTIADLVARDKLDINLNPNYQGKHSIKDTHFMLPSGSILILGGDQVYPTPSMEEYDLRFRIPFEAASKKYPDKNTGKRKMFAIPGNHDWYDGLGNFIKLFCQKRTIGKWLTCQNRSYFAIKLPHNYWLWAIDVQLNSDIDQPQKDYFEEVVTNHVQDGDKIILCTAEPAWVRKVIRRKDSSYPRLKFFVETFITGNKKNLTKNKELKLVATLTGDLHHYSRYEEFKKTQAGNEYTNQLITAGGGGAFLHATHNLPNELTGHYEEKHPDKTNIQYNDPKLQACFPAKKTSRLLANKILAFPFNNLKFWLLMGFMQLLLAWMLESTTQFQNPTFMGQMSAINDVTEFFKTIIRSLLHNPPVIIICIIVVAGMVAFTDRNSGKMNYWWFGLLHGLIQLLNMFLLIWIFSWFNINKLGLEIKGDFKDVFEFAIVYGIEALLIGGFMGSLIMGIYLWFSNCFLNIHVNESFSSMSYQHFKNFLRLHITQEGDLIIYSVGVEKVVTKWSEEGEGEMMTFFSANNPEYYLIEPPIVIKNLNKIL